MSRKRGAPDATRTPLLLLGVASVVFLGLHVYLLRDVGLALDEWYFVLYKGQWHDSIFLPYNAQPAAGVILIYRLWAHGIGVGNRLPLTLGYALMHLAVCAAVYALARRRVGAWGAAGLTLLAMFLGRAWEVLLFPPALTHLLPALSLCVTWLVLDRGGRGSEKAGATALLAFCAVSSGGIVYVLIGLTAEIVARRAWRDLWVVALPAGVHLAWRIDQGAFGGDLPLGANLRALPEWTIKQLSTVVGAVIGAGPVIGAALLVVVIALAAWRLRHASLSPRLIGLVTTFVATPLVVATGRASDTPPTSSRYIYVGAIVLLLLVAELAAGVRPERWPVRARTAACLLVAASCLAGIFELRDGKVFWLRSSDATAARIGVLSLAGDRVPEQFSVTEPSTLVYWPALIRGFIRSFGTDAIDGPSQLAAALPSSRQEADLVLRNALIREVPVSSIDASHCRAIAQRNGETAVLAGSVLVLTSNSPGEIRLRRFADRGAGASFRFQHAGDELGFSIAQDAIDRPWRLAAPSALVRICQRDGRDARLREPQERQTRQ